MNQQVNIISDFSYHSPTLDSFRNESMDIKFEEFKRYLTVGKGLSAKTIDTYLSKFLFFDIWLISNKKRISRDTVEEFLYEKKTKGLKNSSINSYIQAFNHLANLSKIKNYDYKFMEGIESLPKQKAQIIPLSKDEANLLINTPLDYKNRNGVNCKNLDFVYLTLTEFFLITGCRFDEGASLQVKNLDIDNNRAYLINTKNKTNRYIFYDGPIKNKLKLMIKNKNPYDLVFTNSKGKKIINGDFDNNIKKRAKIAGIKKKINAHLLRHTFGTLYYNQTHDIEMTASLMGHKDIQVTHETYVHLDTEGLQKSYRKYPLVAKYIPTHDVLKELKNLIESQKLIDDNRFDFNITISNNKLELKVNVKEA